MNLYLLTFVILKNITLYKLLILILVCASANIYAQPKDSLPSFGSPLDIPLYLSGNFAELRRNHFHTGIDIKTQGVVGKNILAAEEGVISRISVSPYGYGLALYIEHPNGYTTVYGHLLSFSSKIASVVREKQYLEKSFSVDFNPETPIHVKRGEIVALSGNTGGSGGPHLHFEIRKTDTGRPQNPLLFGFKIKDDIPPRIRGVRFHPLADTTLINNKQEAQSFVVNGNAGKYHLKPGQDIKVYGAFGLSLHALDFLNESANRCGIYTLALKINDELISASRFDELDFSTVRHINTYKDYSAFKSHSWHYHKSFVEPGNMLEIYDFKSPELGVINETTPGKHQVTYATTDAYGNESKLEFEFTSLEKPSVLIPAPEPYDAYFPFDRENHFEYADELEITIPANALYSDLRFQFSRQVKTADSYSPHFLVQNDHVPLQLAFEMKFSLKNIPGAIHDKLVCERSDVAGRKSYLKGKVDDGFYVVEPRDFGKFTLVADTTAPTLTARKWSTGGGVSNSTELQFNINDDRSGIKKYNGYLNGEWVLVQYEPKNKMIFLKVGESNFQKGKNTLELHIEDACGNLTTKQFEYTY